VLAFFFVVCYRKCVRSQQLNKGKRHMRKRAYVRSGEKGAAKRPCARKNTTVCRCIFNRGSTVTGLPKRRDVRGLSTIRQMGFGGSGDRTPQRMDVGFLTKVSRVTRDPSTVNGRGIGRSCPFGGLPERVRAGRKAREATACRRGFVPSGVKRWVLR